MRFHVKRLLIGVWTTAALGFLLVILLTREGPARTLLFEPRDHLSRHVPRDDDDVKGPGVEAFEETALKILERLQAVTEKMSRKPGGKISTLKPPVTVRSATERAPFHPAIHADAHAHDHKHVGGDIAAKNFTKAQLTELMERYGHLAHVTEEERLYARADYNVDHVWPGEDEQHDRIYAQINHVPAVKPGATRRPLEILVFNGLPTDARPGTSKFEKDKCKVRECTLTADITRAKRADVILFQNTIHQPYTGGKRANQTWVLFLLESPPHTMGLGEFRGLVNLTASYRRDSHIVTPYEKFLPHEDVDHLPDRPAKNYAADKPKKVAWFVSNCGTTNGRLAYAQELQKHIHVDIYGNCGTLHCFRSHADQCFTMLSAQYKFYLSFENSNCPDYITEKLYWNALKNDIIPVVMGARREEYAAVAPPHSFIHVDDFDGPEALAEYLNLLDNDDDMYNSYFLWKDTGKFINTFFWCRLCAMAHEALLTPRWVDDVEGWWRGDNQCKGLMPGQKWSSWRNGS